ncbi:hypothetical protein BDV19DRAFT_368831 [Aspergillus venezuelensis]
MPESSHRGFGMQSVPARPADRRQFTVGIICALAVEASAVKALFDITYDTYSKYYGKPRNDPNVYFNGRMGNENVVLCKSPRSGKSAAASVMSSLLTAYPNVDKVLVVGICGGLPSISGRRQRSLGDVIVSDSMIVYDFGKQHADGFHLADETLHVHKFAEAALIDSFNMFEVRQEMEIKLANHLLQLRYNQAWSETEAAKDDQTAAAHTDATDSSWRGSLPRSTGNMKSPKIHIGRMASADRVVKSEVHRDDLAREHGAIGFEMEGSGIWDQKVPCIIVKGISDWADHRKNDDWHFYAAATGAAAAKVLVEYLMPNEDSEVDRYWMVPFPRNTDFVGRDREIQQIQDMILSPYGPSKVAISGLGGVGKTQIALQMAYRARKRNPECPVVWIPCTSVETIEQSYVSAAKVLGLDTTSPLEAREYLDAQLTGGFANPLLILDNVDDPAVWEFLKNNLPRSREGRTLITTRNQRVAVDAASSHIVTIKAPDKQTAIDILSKKVENKALLTDRHSMSNLLEKLTYLPLAIVQAASYLNKNPNITFPRYMELLDGQKPRTVDVLSADFMDEGRYANMPNPVATTWLLSFKQLQRLNPLAAEYLQLIACVHYQGIPQGFLPPSENMAEQVDALGLLGAFAFITVHPKTGFLSCHRLVHLATRSWMRQNEQYEEYLDKALHHLHWKIFWRNPTETRILQRDCLPHVLSLLNEKELSNEHGSRRGDNFPLIYFVAKALKNESRHREALEFDREVLKMRKEALGKQNTATLSSRLDLAATYQTLGRLENAEKQTLKALAGYKELLGEHEIETADAMGALAHLYKLQGRFPEAEALDQKALEIWKRNPSDSHVASAQMENIANTYDLQGRRSEAAAIRSGMQKSDQQTLKPETLDTLDKIIAGVAKSRSSPLLETAQGFFEKLILMDWPESKQVDVFASGDQIVHLWLKFQDPQKAEQLATRLVKKATELLGERNETTIRARYTLAMAYMSSHGKLPKAEELMLKVLADQREVMGNSHIPISLTMFALANIYARRGQLTDAKSMKKDATRVRVREDVLNPNDPQLMDNMFVFAQQNATIGAKEDAIYLMDKAVLLARQFLGSGDPRTKTYVAFLAKLQETNPVAPANQSLSVSPAPERRRLVDNFRLRSLSDKTRKFFRG